LVIPYSSTGISQIPRRDAGFDKVTFHAPFDAGGGRSAETPTANDGRADYNPTRQDQMFFRMGRESIVEQNGAASYSAYPADDIGDTSLNQSYPLLVVSHFQHQHVWQLEDQLYAYQPTRTPLTRR